MMNHLLLESVVKLLHPGLVELAETLGNRKMTTAGSESHTFSLAKTEPNRDCEMATSVIPVPGGHRTSSRSAPGYSTLSPCWQSLSARKRSLNHTTKMNNQCTTLQHYLK